MKYFLLIISLFALQACTLYGFTNDYKKLSESEKATVIPLKSFDETDSEHIYKINGVQLKSELKKHAKSMVYVFTNGCKSKYCLPMSNYEQYAKEHDYKLFLVMNGFGSVNETTKQRSEVFTEPLFAIDSDFYKTNIRNRYTNIFTNDLRGLPLAAKPKWEGDIYFFEGDKLLKITNELPN